MIWLYTLYKTINACNDMKQSTPSDKRRGYDDSVDPETGIQTQTSNQNVKQVRTATNFKTVLLDRLKVYRTGENQLLPERLKLY